MLLEIVMLVRPEQLWNAYCQIELTLSGIVILVKAVQSPKA